MLALLLLAFVVVPIVEIAVLVEVGGAIGVGPTIALVILVSAIGAWLTRHEGFVVLARIRARLAEGRLPGDELIDGALVLAGGVLLLTPGFVTDALGLALLFPLTRLPVRTVVRRRLGLRVERVVVRRSGPTDDVIDV